MRLTRSPTALLALLLCGASMAGCSNAATTGTSSPTSYSAADLEARKSYLESVAAGAGIASPPDIDLIRFVSSEEWAGVQIDCLNEAGFPAKLLPDGQGIDTTDVPDSQLKDGGPFQLARYTCESQYTPNSAREEGLSDAQLGLLYDWYVEESVPCLEALGYAITPPPSRQTFAQTYFSSEGWMPYSSIDVESMPDNEWNALNKACPQVPADDVLYG